MNYLKPFLLLGCLAIILFAVSREFFDSEGMKIQEIKIVGASSGVAARIRKTLDPAIGSPLWKIPVDQAARAVKQDPWVESVDVSRRFPRTLAIEVVERKPFVVLGNGSGSFKYIDASNTVIDRAPPQEVGKYPLLIGSSFENRKDLRAQAIELLKSLPSEGVISRSDISDVEFDDEHGYRLTLIKNGIVVDIGKENIPLHVDRARRVVQYLSDHNINATRVDSDYAKKVLVKVRKDR